MEEIAPTAGRLDRLRGRLSRSQSAVGKSLLGLLGGGDLDEDSWEEIEDTLLIADLGSATTEQIMTRLRSELAAGSVKSEADARALLRTVLIEALHPEFDRSIKALPHDSTPGCCWSSASTAPARPPAPASWRACSSRTVAGCCSALPTRSARPPRTSCRPGPSGWAPRWCVVPRVVIPPRSPSTR
ncbi:SRP54-type, helical bundle domain protein [Rhodococcus sp. MTM3W5.2]|nr:SRP54-type, helical bundle domain protein [Rhodococcus sp. MTM3W5.2]